MPSLRCWRSSREALSGAGCHAVETQRKPVVGSFTRKRAAARKAMVGLAADGRPLAVVEEAVKKIASRAAIRPEPTAALRSRPSGLHTSPDGGEGAGHERQLFAARAAGLDPYPTHDIINLDGGHLFAQRSCNSRSRRATSKLRGAPLLARPTRMQICVVFNNWNCSSRLPRMAKSQFTPREDSHWRYDATAIADMHR